MEHSPPQETPLETLQNTQAATPAPTQPFSFKDFSTSIPLTEAQASYVTEIMVVMEQTGEMGRFDISEPPIMVDFGQ